MTTTSIEEQGWEALRQFPLFAALPEEDWGRLRPLMRRETAASGTMILDDTDLSDDAFVLETGVLQAFRDTPFGPQVLSTLKSGALFGEQHLLDGLGRSASLQTTEPSVLWRIDGFRLLEWMGQEPEVANRFYRIFWRSLATKLGAANQELKQFFGGQQAEMSGGFAADIEQVPRPAWFAPPDGVDSGTPPMSLPEIPPDTIDVLAKRAVLEQLKLAPEEIDLLFQYGEELMLPANEAIFREGDFGDTLYFVLEGQVRISKQIPGVGEEALAIVDKGSFFGEMALVADNAVRSADCYAHDGPVLLLAFREHVFSAREGIADHVMSLLQTICKMISNRLRETNEKLVSWRRMAGGFF